MDNRASRLLEFRYGDEVSGTERDAPGTDFSPVLQWVQDVPAAPLLSSS
jgi:hypothetical protein